MTTYKAIEHLINNKSVDAKTAERAAYDAYVHNKIDGLELDALNERISINYYLTLGQGAYKYI